MCSWGLTEICCSDVVLNNELQTFLHDPRGEIWEEVRTPIPQGRQGGQCPGLGGLYAEQAQHKWWAELEL